MIVLARSDVLEYLKENYECWFSVRFLQTKLDLSLRSIQKNLARLRKDRYVNVKIEVGKKRGRVPLYQYRFIDE